jgi:glycosyltransferase involved in cell wall biosynthesis
MAAKLSRTPIVLNLRDTLDPDRKAPRMKFRLIFGAADHVFYLSADMAQRWRQVAPNAMRSCSVTYSIVEPERFAALPPSAHEPPVVLVPGVFWPKKGQLEFIRNVVPALAREGIETWFAGDFAPGTNPYAAACAEAARPFEGSAKFLGFRADMPALYGQAAVVAVPSRHEGLMRGMIEAMSCARPVVSFDLCSARELLEHESGGAGVVVPMGGYAGMAEALIRLARDQDAQAVAGRAGSTAAGRLFDPERVVDAYERVYSALGTH